MGVTALVFAITLATFKLRDVTGVWLTGVAVLVLVVAPLSAGVALTGFADLPGQPEAQHGRYYFNDHGRLIATTRAGFERGVAGEERLAAGIAIMFSAASALGAAAMVASRQTSL